MIDTDALCDCFSKAHGIYNMNKNQWFCALKMEQDVDWQCTGMSTGTVKVNSKLSWWNL